MKINKSTGFLNKQKGCYHCLIVLDKYNTFKLSFCPSVFTLVDFLKTLTLSAFCRDDKNHTQVETEMLSHIVGLSCR